MPERDGQRKEGEERADAIEGANPDGTDGVPGKFLRMAGGDSTRARALLQRAVERKGGNGEGQQLHPAMRQRAEKSLGASVGDVRVHAGPDAQHANAELGSKAFAVGNEVMLGAGVENTANPILAHEVAHTVQQQGSAPGVATKLERDVAGSPHERDADQAAQRMMMGLPARVSQLGAPRIQCFDSYEHKALGDAGGGDQKIKLDCGLTISWGDATCLMGDFYGSEEALMKADKQEVLRLLAAVQTETGEAEEHGGKPTGKESAKNEKKFEGSTAWRDVSHYDEAGHKTGKKEGQARGTEGKTYIELADENGDHFSPANAGRYQTMHEKALLLAARAHDETDEAKKDALLNEANLTDAAACHFLTDAFSSGHAISGATGRQAGAEVWKEQHGAIIAAITSAAKNDGALFGHIAKNSGITTTPEIAGLIETAVRGLVSALGSHAPSLCLKLVHDKLNSDGLDVINARGDKWKTFGDTNLSKAPETIKIGSEAVERSRMEIQQAGNQGATQMRLSALDLIPAQIGFCGSFLSLEEFTQREDIFKGYLVPLLLDATPNNPLYGLIKDNVGLLAVKGEEFGMKAQNFEHGLDKRVAHGLEEMVSGDVGGGVRTRDENMDHMMRSR